MSFSWEMCVRLYGPASKAELIGLHEPRLRERAENLVFSEIRSTHW